jgi:tetratricopeptide (TPR) repeat protein
LNADYILQGTIQRNQDKLQLGAHLVNVADGSTVWEQNFDSDLKDIFRIQGEIAQGITGALNVELRPSERKILAVTPTTDMEAYENYIQGRLLLDRQTPNDNDEAEKFFKKASGQDKSYALPQIALAETYMQRVEADFDPSPKWLEQAASALEKASATDPNSAEYSQATAQLYRLQGLTGKSLSAARRAVELQPNCADAHYALALSLFAAQHASDADSEFITTLQLRPDFAEPLIYRAQLAFFSGNVPLADSLLGKAVERAPRSPQIHVELAQQLLRRGRFADAEVEARKALQLLPKASDFIGLLGTTELWQGKLDDAIDHLKKASDNLDDAELYRLLGLAYRLKGKKSSFDKSLRNSLRLDSENLERDSSDVLLSYHILADQCLLDTTFEYESELSRLQKKSLRLNDPTERSRMTAIIYCAVGRYDRMLAALRDALKSKGISAAYIAADPYFAPASSDAKFRALVGLR